MQHIYDFYIKGANEEHHYHNRIVLDQGRIGKAGRVILARLNEARLASGLPKLVNGFNMEDFRLKKLR